MYHNRYTQAVSKIKAPEGAVEKMLKTAESFEKKEKVIHMKKWIKKMDKECGCGISCCCGHSRSDYWI